LYILIILPGFVGNPVTNAQVTGICKPTLVVVEVDTAVRYAKTVAGSAYNNQQKAAVVMVGRQLEQRQQ
jgi:hypothetical protein